MPGRSRYQEELTNDQDEVFVVNALVLAWDPCPSLMFALLGSSRISRVIVKKYMGLLLRPAPWLACFETCSLCFHLGEVLIV